MSLDDDFEAAVEHVKTLTENPGSDFFLDIYARFKHAGEGTGPTTDRPGMFSVKDKAKWDAWSKHFKTGATAEESKQQYVELVQSKDSAWVRPSAA